MFNRTDIIAKICADFDLPTGRALRVITSLENEIVQNVRAQKTVRLIGFGMFYHTIRHSRLLYDFQNPTKKRLVLDKKRLVFRPSKLLKHSLQELRSGKKREMSSQRYLATDAAQAKMLRPPVKDKSAIPIRVLKKPQEPQIIEGSLGLPGVVMLRKLIPYLKLSHITALELKTTKDKGEILLLTCGFPVSLAKISPELFETFKDNLARLLTVPAGTEWENYNIETDDLSLAVAYFTSADTEIIRLERKNIPALNINLAFDSPTLLRLKEILSQKQGLIVILSPKNQGKTTVTQNLAKQFKISEEAIFDCPASQTDAKHRALAVLTHLGNTIDEAKKNFELWPQNPKVYLNCRVIPKVCPACPTEPYSSNLKQEIKIKSALSGLDITEIPSRWNLVVQKPCRHGQALLLLESYLADDQHTSKPALRQQIALKLISGEIAVHPAIELL